MDKFCVSLLIPRIHFETNKRAVTISAACGSYVECKAQQIEHELRELYAHAQENDFASKGTYDGIELHWGSLVPIFEKGKCYLQIWGTVRCKSEQATWATTVQPNRIGMTTPATCWQQLGQRPTAAPRITNVRRVERRLRTGS